MNYAEEMLARQMLLWRSICASLPAETENEVQLSSKEALAFEEELRAVQGMRGADSVQEASVSRNTTVLDAIARHAVRAAVDLMRRDTGGHRRLAAENMRGLREYGGDDTWNSDGFHADVAQEADTLMRALAKESERRSTDISLRGAEAAANGAYVPAFGGAAVGETAVYSVSAQEISRRFERDSRRYDAAFTRYE